jgi:DNA-binding NarL/FixJ family response regulator
MSHPRHDERALRPNEQIAKSGSVASMAANLEPATVVIIEKRPLIRDLLARCLASSAGFEIVPVATVDEYLESGRSRNPLVVLISVTGSPEAEETQSAIRHAAQSLIGTPIAVLSDGEELHQVMSVLRAGTSGYISTSMPLDVAIEALRLVRAGGQFLPASCVVAKSRSDMLPAEKPMQSRLFGMFTPRQAAVIEALCQGKANKIIAYELKMRESTVKVHVRNIMRKLKAKNRTEVAYITNQLILSGPQAET